MGTPKKIVNSSSNTKKDKNPKFQDNYLKISFIENLPIYLLCLILIVFSIILYFQILNFGLIHFDDEGFIKKYVGFVNSNMTIKQILNDTFGASFYRPILTLSLFFDAVIWGSNPFGYHLSNIIFHALNLILLFLTLNKLKFSKTISFVFSVIFLSHPILTPSVAWISGRNDSLLAIFVLSSFLSFLYAIDIKDKLNYPFLLLHLLFFLIATLTKENAVIFPLLLLIFYIVIKQEKPFSNRTVQLGICWILIILIFFVIRSVVPLFNTKYDIYGLQAIIINSASLPAIIGKIFLPIKMSGCSNYDIISISTGIIFGLFLIIYPLLLKNKINMKLYYFGIVWFSLTLLPTFFVKIHITSYDYLEHRSYLPFVGLLISLICILKSYNINFKNRSTKIILFSILILLSFRSFIYSRTFDNPVSFWSNNIKQYPDNFQGYLSLGRYYLTQNNLKSAEDLINKAFEHNNNNFDVYQALSALEIKKLNYKKSENYALKSLELNDENEFAYETLSASYIGNRNYIQAVDAAKKGISFDKEKNISDLYFNLGLAYYIIGKYKESIEAYQHGLKINPGFAHGYTNIAASYYLLGEINYSIKYFYKALEIDPMLPEPNNNLIKLFIKSNPKLAFEIANLYRKRGGKLESNVEKMLGW